MTSLNCWFKGDIANALDAQDATLDGAISTIRPRDIETLNFIRGYRAALDAVRIAFGIPPRGTGSTAASEPETKRIGSGNL